MFKTWTTYEYDKLTRRLNQCCIVIEESPCPRGPINNWTTKSLKIFKDFVFCKLSVVYDHCDVHTFCYRHRAWGDCEECLTYWCQILLTDIMSASKPFFTVTQCYCPRGKSLSLLGRLRRVDLITWVRCPYVRPYVSPSVRPQKVFPIPMKFGT